MSGLASVDHVGLNVPDLDQAVDFFVDVLGATEVYRTQRSGPPALMQEVFEVHPRLAFKVAMLQLPPNLKVELFEWSERGDARDRNAAHPNAADPGGHHLCWQVTDLERTWSELANRPELQPLGGVNLVSGGPLAGTRWAYFKTAWGLRIEVVERPA